MAKKKQPSVLNQKWTMSFMQLALFAVVFAGVGVLAVWQTFAAPGGGKGGKPSGGNGTISLNLPPMIDKNGDGQATYGDGVNFTISTTATTQPWVNLQCFQNGVLVAQGWSGYFDSALGGNGKDKYFTLSSPSWTSGGADCIGYLDEYVVKGSGGGYQQLASVKFQVNPLSP